MDGYLNVKQVSNELQEPEETIRRWLRTGELAGTKHGNRWYVHPKDNEGCSRRRALEYSRSASQKRTIVTELGVVAVQHPEAESTNPPASTGPETTVRASSGTRFRNGGITPGAGC